MSPGEIRRLRNSLGLTQGIFADRLKVTRETVSRWESGRLKPRQALQIAMAQMTSTDANGAGKQRIRAKDVVRLRRELRLTQSQFGLLLHTTRFTVLRWESGLNAPHPASVEVMKRLGKRRNG